MRNSILFLILCVAISCSSDEGEVVSDFNFMLNGQSEPAFLAYKREEAVNDGNDVKTTLLIQMSEQDCGGNCSARGFIEVQIISPKKESITGTYVFTENPNNNVTGSFNMFQIPAYVFKSGKFTLSKLGSNHYKIVFNDVVGEWGVFYTDRQKCLIDGYFDGIFGNY